MTKAAEDFKESIHDAQVMLEMMNGELTQDQLHVMKRACLVIAMATWETYIKECIGELVARKVAELGKYYSPAANALQGRLDKELKHFSNPNTERTQKLFVEFAHVDVTREWAKKQADIDGWIVKRGEAAHVAIKKDNKGVHIIDKPGLKKVIKGLERLVEATEAELAKP